MDKNYIIVKTRINKPFNCYNMKINIQSAWEEKELLLIPTIGVGFKSKTVYAVWLFWAVELDFNK